MDPQASKLRRRVQRLLANGLLERPPGALWIAQATTPGELCEAYGLVHDVFVDEGYIGPVSYGMRIRLHELLPEMCTFIARLDGRVVGVISAVSDSLDMGLPSDATFGHELGLLRSRGRKLVEITNLVVRPEFRSTSIFLELARCITAHALNQSCDDAFVSISPHHAEFFRGVLGFERWGKRRKRHDNALDIVQGSRCDVLGFREELFHRDALLEERAFLHSWFFDENPCFELTRESVPRARFAFLTRETLTRLLGERTDWPAAVGPCKLDGLRRRWGNLLPALEVSVRCSMRPDRSMELG